MRGPRILAVVMVLVAATLWTAIAAAAGPVMVTSFSGAKQKKLRERISKSLEGAGTTLVEGDDSLGEESSDSDFASVAKEKQVAAFVTGHTDMRKSGWTLKLTVRNGADGAVIEEVAIKSGWLPGLLKAIDKDAAAKLAGPLDQGKLPEEEEPEPAAEESPPDEEAEEDDEPEEEPDEPEKAGPPGKRPSPLSLDVGVRRFSRNYEYNQDVNRNLRTHSIGAPAFRVGLGWYPVAHFTGGVPANIGIIGDFEQSFAASTDLESGTGNEDFATTMRSFSGGLRWRIPLSAHELGVTARYGQQSVEVDGDEDPASTAPTGSPIERDFVPDSAYQYIRPGLDFRLAFGPVGVGVYGGYRLLLGTGDIEDDVWFPEASGSGFDAGLFLSYEFVKSLHVLAGFDIRRYGLAMNSSPDDTGVQTPDPDDDRDVAGGAVDQYLTGHLGIEWRLGGD